MIHGQVDKQVKYKKMGIYQNIHRKSSKNFAIVNVLIKEIMENNYLAIAIPLFVNSLPAMQ